MSVQADIELLADYTRLVRDEGEGFRLDVAKVVWIGVQPELNWRPWRRWKREPSPERLSRAQAAVLRDPRCFRSCEQCGTRCPNGQMFGEICTACAELAGIVF